MRCATEARRSVPRSVRRSRPAAAGSSARWSMPSSRPAGSTTRRAAHVKLPRRARRRPPCRSEEHTSELQSRRDLVCRLLLEKKKKKKNKNKTRNKKSIQRTQPKSIIFYYQNNNTLKTISKLQYCIHLNQITYL